MKNWQKKVEEYNKLGYEYLGLFFSGMDVYSEWRTLEGKIIRLYYDN